MFLQEPSAENKGLFAFVRKCYHVVVRILHAGIIKIRQLVQTCKSYGDFFIFVDIARPGIPFYTANVAIVIIAFVFWKFNAKPIR